MASSGNFATIGGLEKNTGGFTFSQGNLKYSVSTNQRGFIGSTAFPNTGKWYFECRVIGVGAGTSNADDVYIGVCEPDKMRSNLTGSRGGASVSGAGGYTVNSYAGAAYLDGVKQSDDSIGYIRNFPQIFGIAIDRDNNNFKWTYDGSSYSSTYSIPADVDLYLYLGSGGGSSTASGVFNFGQDSTFAGAISAGGNADGNSIGDFSLSVPTNFLALSSANLPISDDIDPAQTDDNIPTKQFGVVLYTGNGGASLSVTGLGFQPDLVWLKQRSASEAYSNNLIDSTRGRSKTLYSSRADAEATSASDKDFGTFDSDGFTVLDDFNTNMNQSSITNVAWCWRANGGTTSSNTQGDITSTVQVNDKAGFSIISFSGSGSAQSVGHGLSAAPDMVITKNRSTTDDWRVHHKGLTNGVGTYHLKLNSNVAQTNDASCMSGSPSSTVLNLGNNTSMNGSGNNIIMYAWREIEGYSKFGSFEGNSNDDGPFIYTGFRPRLVFCKAIDATENWQVRDTARSTFNADSQVRIYWNSNAAEGSASTASPIDFLSNGFKVRGSNSEINSNTILYGAWGDVPFRYNNTF